MHSRDLVPHRTGRNRRFIPVHKAVKKVGQDVCNLLPAMHTLTGCNSTSSLNGIGKKGGFTTLKKHKDDLVGLKRTWVQTAQSQAMKL